MTRNIHLPLFRNKTKKNKKYKNEKLQRPDGSDKVSLLVFITTLRNHFGVVYLFFHLSFCNKRCQSGFRELRFYEFSMFSKIRLKFYDRGRQPTASGPEPIR